MTGHTTPLSLSVEPVSGQLRILIRGPVTEGFNPTAELRKVRDFVTKANPLLPVLINLDGVDRMNSAGIRAWITFITALRLKHEVRLTGISEAFAEILALSPDLVGNEPIEIDTFQVPYLYKRCGDRFIISVNRAEIGKRGTWTGSRVRKCAGCGGESDLDVVEDDYFAFLKSRKQE